MNENRTDKGTDGIESAESRKDAAVAAGTGDDRGARRDRAADRDVRDGKDLAGARGTADGKGLGTADGKDLGTGDGRDLTAGRQAATGADASPDGRERVRRDEDARTPVHPPQPPPPLTADSAPPPAPAGPAPTGATTPRPLSAKTPDGARTPDAAAKDGARTDGSRGTGSARSATGTAAAGATGSGASSSGSLTLFPREESDKLGQQLQTAVAGFVDEPRASVAEADQILGQIADRFTEAVTERRRHLRTSWGEDDGGADTEQLRLALRDYRELADRLLQG
ncbi:hypothetical protein [Streptomyces doudnae]|uniref:Uncharacterized protein n=1 Tax=Streptomyces doudnae TaxID=3075536 RepID=A0ABD5EMF8_9ACTN|nr:hypothetical protein [Streptomyces sp. DSM 41981]MDT0435050.1 hypothetical protein [Streptomyces sp. DSM 41981]